MTNQFNRAIKEVIQRNDHMLKTQLFVAVLGMMVNRLLTAELLSEMYFRDQLTRMFLIGAFFTERIAGCLIPVSHFNLIVATVCQGFVVSHVVDCAQI